MDSADGLTSAKLTKRRRRELEAAEAVPEQRVSDDAGRKGHKPEQAERSGQEHGGPPPLRARRGWFDSHQVQTRVSNARDLVHA